MLTLGLAPIVIGLLVVGFLLISLLMIFIVLIQRPQGGGLSEAFGSNSGSGHTAFGAKTGDALTSATIGIFILFIVGAIVLNFATRPTSAYTGPPEAVPAEEEEGAGGAQGEGAAGEGATQGGGNQVVPMSPEDAPIPTSEGFVLPQQTDEGEGAGDESGGGGGEGDASGASTEEPAGDEPQSEDAPQ